MSIGNTFGATSLSSFGGFWIAIAIILTPGGFEIEESYDSLEFQHAFSLFLFVGPLPALSTSSAFGEGHADSFQGWFIFTTILLMCTFSSSVAHCSIFLTLDVAFLCLALGRRYPHLDGTAYVPHGNLTYVGGVFGMLSAFAAWYNALAGIAASTHTYWSPILENNELLLTFLGVDFSVCRCCSFPGLRTAENVVKEPQLMLEVKYRIRIDNFLILFTVQYNLKACPKPKTQSTQLKSKGENSPHPGAKLH